MKSLCVRLARGWNRVWRRRGRVFADRYHDEVLGCPRQVRRAIRYVLKNARRHGIVLARALLDCCSSEVWFRGYEGRTEEQVRRMQREAAGWRAVLGARPCRGARSWLLREGWRLDGPLFVDDRPRRVA